MNQWDHVSVSVRIYVAVNVTIIINFGILGYLVIYIDALNRW